MKTSTSPKTTRHSNPKGKRSIPAAPSQNDAPRPLRSTDEILKERLEQRDDRGEMPKAGHEPDRTENDKGTDRADRGGIPDEDFPANEDGRTESGQDDFLAEPAETDAAQLADEEELPSASDRRSSAFRDLVPAEHAAPDKSSS